MEVTSTAKSQSRQNRTTRKKAEEKSTEFSYKNAAKDPDLSPDEQALSSLSTFDMDILLMESWDLSRLQVIAQIHAADGATLGNDLFKWWTETSDHIMRWG